MVWTLFGHILVTYWYYMTKMWPYTHPYPVPFREGGLLTDFGGWVNQVERALWRPDPRRRQNNKRFCSQKGIRTKSSKSSRITLSVASSLDDDFLKCGSVALYLSFTRHFVKLDSGNRRTEFTLQLHPIRRLSIRHADSNWRRGRVCNWTHMYIDHHN